MEINATFYRLPREKTFENWQEQSCPGFLYAVKGSQAVTHFKRLKPGAKSFRLLLKRATRLGSGLGPFLWQLPPTDAFGHVDSKVFPTMVTPVSVRLESGILSLVDLRSDG